MSPWRYGVVYDWNMRLNMNDEQLQSLEEVKQFTNSSQTIDFKGINTKEKYQWIEEVLKKFKYQRLKRTGKGILRRYLEKVTGYSRAQVARLVGRYQELGRLETKEYHRYRFPEKYTMAEVGLLAVTDELHGWLSGPATKRIMEREYEVYGHAQFKNISGISIAQIYNLRHSKRYRAKRYTHTKPVLSRIGERTKPESQGCPGYIRVDTVHQGDNKRQKGVYHINSVDEVTQWEIVASVSEYPNTIWNHY